MNPARVNLLVPVSEQRAAFEPGDQVRVHCHAKDLTGEELEGYNPDWWPDDEGPGRGEVGRVVGLDDTFQVQVRFASCGSWWTPRNSLEHV